MGRIRGACWGVAKAFQDVSTLPFTSKVDVHRQPQEPSQCNQECQPITSPFYMGFLFEITNLESRNEIFHNLKVFIIAW